MKTDALISRLAAGAGRFERLSIGRDLAVIAAGAMIVCSLASLAVRGPVPGAMWHGAAMSTKLAYAAALAASNALLLRSLVFPGQSTLQHGRAVMLVFLGMAVVGLIAIAGVPADGRLGYVLGKTALICPWAILVLSLPALVGLLRLTRRFAPTDLHVTGAACGLLAGSIAAAGYALSCQEAAIGFVAVWYSAGILISGAVGAIVGGRALRW